MAKRRKHKSSGRRRRVGSSKMNANNPIVKWGSIIAGLFFGDKINAPIDKMVGTQLDPKIIGGVELVGGGLLVFGKGKKTMFKTVGGGLLLGAGGNKLLAEFGINMPSLGSVLGNTYGRVPVIGNTYGRVPVIAGRRMGAYTTNSALNGSMGSYSPNSSLNGHSNKVMSGTGAAAGAGCI